MCGLSGSFFCFHCIFVFRHSMAGCADNDDSTRASSYSPTAHINYALSVLRIAPHCAAPSTHTHGTAADNTNIIIIILYCMLSVRVSCVRCMSVFVDVYKCAYITLLNSPARQNTWNVYICTYINEAYINTYYTPFTHILARHRAQRRVGVDGRPTGPPESTTVCACMWQKRVCIINKVRLERAFIFLVRRQVSSRCHRVVLLGDSITRAFWVDSIPKNLRTTWDEDAALL